MKIKLGKALSLIEKGSIMLSSLWLTGGGDFRIFAFLAYSSSIFILLLRWKQALWTLFQEKFLWFFIGLLFLSVLWAADFSESFYRSLKLAGLILIGFSISVRFGLKEQVEIFAFSGSLLVIVSFFYCLILPDKGIVDGGAWQGIYQQKNVLGRIMNISTITFILQAMSCQRYRWLNLIFAALAFALVILSNSSSSSLILLTLLAVLPLYRALGWSYSWIIPFFSIVILSIGSLSLLFVNRLDYFLDFIGKDATLTGRLPLWEMIFAKIWEHPWLGYGFGGFWTGWSGEAADIWRIENWEPPHSHNGLLDLWLAVGLVGVVLATLVLATIFFRSLHCLRSSKSASDIWPLLFLTLLILTNITESTMAVHSSIYWVLYIAVALSTHWKVRKQHALNFEQRISPNPFSESVSS